MKLCALKANYLFTFWTCFTYDMTPISGGTAPLSLVKYIIQYISAIFKH